MRPRETAQAEALLLQNEMWCVNACAKFQSRDSAKNQIWISIDDEDRQIAGLIVQAKRSLLPVLKNRVSVPPLRFLTGLFDNNPVHSLQGKKEDVLLMEATLEKNGLYAAENIDYDLMILDQLPNNNSPPDLIVCEGFNTPPFGVAKKVLNPDTNTLPKQHIPLLAAGLLIIRRPRPTDMEDLVRLQAAYEQVEVLPAGAAFNPTASRLNTARIFANELMLAAEIGGRLVGKINTNAVGFTRFQIGGVFVDPAYRGMGIACAMACKFAADLVSLGRGISLFVKKTNAPARHVYLRTGFKIAGEYRISYY